MYMYFVWAHACFSYMSLAREDSYFLQICVYFDLCEFCCIVLCHILVILWVDSL